MKIIIASVFLILTSVVMALGQFDDGGNCVDCFITVVSGHQVYECRATKTGGNSCATSTGQQECSIAGPCGALNEFTASACPVPKSIGDISAKRNVIKEVSSISPLFGRVLTFGINSGNLGIDGAKIFILEDDTSMEFDVALIKEGNHLTGVKITRLDNAETLELGFQQDFSSLVHGKVLWNIVNWQFN